MKIKPDLDENLRSHYRWMLAHSVKRLVILVKTVGFLSVALLYNVVWRVLLLLRL